MHRHRHQLLCNVLLSDSPQVGSEPVDEQTRRPLPHEHEDTDHYRHHVGDDLLLTSAFSSGLPRGYELAPNVEKHQNDVELGDIRHPQPADCGVRKGEGAAGLALIAKHVVQAEEDRQLEDQRETGTQRADLVLLVELHGLLVQDLLVVFVLLLERLDLLLLVLGE